MNNLTAFVGISDRRTCRFSGVDQEGFLARKRTKKMGRRKAWLHPFC